MILMPQKTGHGLMTVWRANLLGSSSKESISCDTSLGTNNQVRADETPPDSVRAMFDGVTGADRGWTSWHH